MKRIKKIDESHRKQIRKRWEEREKKHSKYKILKETIMFMWWVIAYSLIREGYEGKDAHQCYDNDYFWGRMKKAWCKGALVISIKFSLKIPGVLTYVAQWVGCHPINQKFNGSIPCQGTGPQLGVCKRQPLDVSLPLFLPSFPSI